MDIQEIKKRNAIVNSELDNLMLTHFKFKTPQEVYTLTVPVKSFVKTLGSDYVGDYLLTYGYEDFSDYITCLYEDKIWTEIEHRLSRKLLKNYQIEIDPYILHDKFVFERVKVADLNPDDLRAWLG